MSAIPTSQLFRSFLKTLYLDGATNFQSFHALTGPNTAALGELVPATVPSGLPVVD